MKHRKESPGFSRGEVQCPNPRCSGCDEGLYLEIQKWKPMIVNGDLRKRWE